MRYVYRKKREKDTLKKFQKLILSIRMMRKKTEFDYGTSLLPEGIVLTIYLLFAPSAFTAEELKCYKSMDAYNYYVGGFVKGGV